MLESFVQYIMVSDMFTQFTLAWARSGITILGSMELCFILLRVREDSMSRKICPIRVSICFSSFLSINFLNPNKSKYVM